ncbi:MAG: hypothetical protein JJE04_02780 [Acidobacteriia bacterium]|nr:hypothetical protein [Terriglobia bacterium]
MADTQYRAALSRMLSSSASCAVVCVEDPDLRPGDVLVVDTEHLNRLQRPLERPERVVLVTHELCGGLPQALSQAWDAGVHSVINDTDPLATAVLAIMSANLRAARMSPAPVRRKGVRDDLQDSRGIGKDSS